MSDRPFLISGRDFEPAVIHHIGLTVRGLVGFLLLLLSLTASAESVMGRVDYAYLQHLNFGVDGEVSSLHVQVGDRVQKGAILIQLDEAHLTADLEAAKAEMVWKKAVLEEATRNWERDNILYEEGSLSQVELDLSYIEQLRAESEYRRSAAHHVTRESRLRYSRIIAPQSGVVLNVNVYPGDRINLQRAERPALVLGSEKAVVRALLTTDIVAPEVGDMLIVVDGGDATSGQVKSIIPAGQDGSRLVTVESSEALPPVGHRVEVRY